MKYKALRENNDIFIDFVHAIFNMYPTFEERGISNLPTKEELIAMRKDKLTISQIAKKRNTSYYFIHQLMKQYGISTEKIKHGGGRK